MNNTVFEKAYAKINLTLDVTGLLPNGYHRLETIMQTISLHDDVTVTKTGGGISITCDKSNVPIGRSNICHKAANLFFESAGIHDSGVKIEIKKRIPQMAGLGGGSADAAAVFRALSILFSHPLSKDRLYDAAAKTGADVGFLMNGGTALCQGIGEKLTPLEMKTKYYVLLAKPYFGISTPEAYKAFDRKKIISAFSSEKMTAAIRRGDDICAYLSNDLEKAVENSDIIKIKELLIKTGAKGALMSGSGSCVYGLFLDMDSCESAKDQIIKYKDRFEFIQTCQTI